MYALYRVFSLLYQQDLDSLLPLLLLLASLTMVIGVLGAISQTHIRRILSFILISQTGYMLMGLALAGMAGERGMAAGVLFLVHDALVITALFCIGGTVEYIFNQGDIERMGGLSRREPVLATLWFLSFLSLAGIPPLGGFFARLALLQVTMAEEAYVLAAVACLVALLLFIPLLRIWHEVFWKPLPEHTPQPRRATVEQVFPGALLVGVLLMFALSISYVVDYSNQSAQQLFNTTEYVDAVLQFTDLEP
jgi:multicomponent Na+:H+ antiporter subunit D